MVLLTDHIVTCGRVYFSEDNKRARAAATAQLNRYRLTEYSLPYLPFATEGRLKIRGRRIREIVLSAEAFEFKLSEFSAIVCHHET